MNNEKFYALLKAGTFWIALNNYYFNYKGDKKLAFKAGDILEVTGLYMDSFDLLVKRTNEKYTVLNSYIKKICFYSKAYCTPDVGDLFVFVNDSSEIPSRSYIKGDILKLISLQRVEKNGNIRGIFTNLSYPKAELKSFIIFGPHFRVDVFRYRGTEFKDADFKNDNKRLNIIGFDKINLINENEDRVIITLTKSPYFQILYS